MRSRLQVRPTSPPRSLRSVHRGNAGWNVSGNDGPGHYVAHTESLPGGPASARLKQTRMASGLEIASHIQYKPACAVMLALSNLAASSSSVNPGNDQPYSQFDRRHIRLSESRIASL